MPGAFRKCVSATTTPILVTLLLTASTCLGQERRGEVITNVPFPFTVANQTLPPGRYVVTPIGETNFRIHAGRQSVVFQTHSVEGKAPRSAARITFHRYRDSYFLSEIWVAASSTGRELFTSAAEKEMASATNRETAVLEVASSLLTTTTDLPIPR